MKQTWEINKIPTWKNKYEYNKFQLLLIIIF